MTNLSHYITAYNLRVTIKNNDNIPSAITKKYTILPFFGSHPSNGNQS